MTNNVSDLDNGAGKIVLQGIPDVIPIKVGSAAVQPGDVLYWDGTDWEKVDQDSSAANGYGYVNLAGVVLGKPRMDTTSPYGRKDIDDTIASGASANLMVGAVKKPLIFIAAIDPQAGSGSVTKYTRWVPVDTNKGNCATAGTFMELTETERNSATDHPGFPSIVNINAPAYDDNFAIFKVVDF